MKYFEFNDEQIEALLKNNYKSGKHVEDMTPPQAQGQRDRARRNYIKKHPNCKRRILTSSIKEDFERAGINEHYQNIVKGK
jgi:hypothetical protein